MRAALLLSVALLAAPAAAQNNAATLADIQSQLSVINSELVQLKGQLETTGAAGLNIEGTSFPDRVVSLEGQLQSLTTQVERLQFRVESVAQDGGNRIEDLRFQLCELTTDCDLGSLPPPSSLGEAQETPAPSGSTTPAEPSGGGAQLAVGEQGQFDAAKAALDSGDNAQAASLFEQFLGAYPTGPLTTQAHLLRAQAQAGSNNSAGAARSFLEAFSGSPDGPQAPAALLGLGKSLGALGQTEEACLTLAEVAIRFPSAPQVAEASSAQAGFGCQ